MDSYTRRPQVKRGPLDRNEARMDPMDCKAGLLRFLSTYELEPRFTMNARFSVDSLGARDRLIAKLRDRPELAIESWEVPVTTEAEILEALRAHTESSPALTAGDVDADWAKAYDSGDEAPGGDNPTPDQDVVDEIGRSLGIQYEDVEELKGAEKVSKRDRHRWELDPASSEDYPDRRKQ